MILYRYASENNQKVGIISDRLLCMLPLPAAKLLASQCSKCS
ncbi:MAG: hypothetical protein ACFN40_01400 [Bacteroidota bacterium]